MGEVSNWKKSYKILTLVHNAINYSLLDTTIRFLNKNPAYGRHWLSWHVWIIAPILWKSANFWNFGHFLGNWKQTRIRTFGDFSGAFCFKKILCHESHAICHLWHMTYHILYVTLHLALMPTAAATYLPQLTPWLLLGLAASNK